MEEVARAIREITGAEPPDEKTTESIRKAYLKDIEVLAKSATNQENQNRTPRFVEVASIPVLERAKSNTPRNVIGYITYPEFSESPVQIKDELSYEIAVKLLEAMRKRLDIGKKKEGVQSLLEDT
jgi:hypothetical protein